MARRTCLLAILASALLAAPAAAPAAPTPPLDHEGRWITDATGRVVILHGWNMVYKLPPYQPAAVGFGADDARFLADNGFNTVRLGIIYKGLEPRPGEIDEDYLEQTAETARLLADEGIFVLLDFHQDQYNERFQGEGFPDWTVVGDARTLPAQPRLGFPANYVAMPALWRAFDHFWANDRASDSRRLQDAFAGAWRRVAESFRDTPQILGYNLLNEPWPGSQWPTCANPEGCPAFDRLFLTPFSERVIGEIREVDPSTLVWYAPNVTFDFGADTWHGDTGDAHAGFAFNNYCLPGDALPAGRPEDEACGATEERVLGLADEQSATTGDALLMTEFGATDDLTVQRRMLEAADRHMVSWQQWAYWNTDPSGSTPDHGLLHDSTKPPAGDNVKRDKLRVSARPYPQVVAGTPLEFDFDHDTRLFELRYSTERASGEGRFGPGSASEVFVSDLHYPEGYDVEVEGARVASAPGAETLRLVTCPGAATVEARVEPASGKRSLPTACG